MAILTPDTETTVACKNCGAPVGAPYCARCGQSRDVGRLGFRSVWDEFIWEFFDLDRGLLHTVAQLTVRPGHVVRAYVLGKRKLFTKPLSFYLIMLALYYLVSTLLKVNPLDLGLGPIGDAQRGAEDGYRGSQTATSKADLARIGAVLNENVKVIFTVLVFFLAFSMRLFYRKSGYHWVDLLAFSFYVIGYSYLPYILTAVLLGWFGKVGWVLALVGAVTVLSLGLYVWSVVQFFERKGLPAILKATLVVFVSVVLYAVLISVVLGGVIGIQMARTGKA